MTADEFRTKLKALGITQKWLCEHLGVQSSTVNRWAQGQANGAEISVPQHVVFVLQLLELLAAEGHNPSDIPDFVVVSAPAPAPAG